MIVSTSYLVRGQRIHSTTSLPVPSVKNLTEVLQHVAWVAGQESPIVNIR